MLSSGEKTSKKIRPSMGEMDEVSQEPPSPEEEITEEERDKKKEKDPSSDMSVVWWYGTGTTYTYRRIVRSQI